MIQELRIVGYRCFANLHVGLKPLTVLIGPNDTGKSTFLRAIETVAGNISLTPDDIFRLRDDVSTGIEIKSTQGGYWSIGHNTFETPHGRDDHAKVDLIPCNLFALPSNGPRLVCDGVSTSKSTPSLNSDGSNLAAIVDYLLRVHLDRFNSFVQCLRRSVPTVSGLAVETPNPNTRRIDITLRGGPSIEPDAMSVGLKYMIFFHALAHHPAPPKILLLEEPENGIHPKRLEEVIGILRGLINGARSDIKPQVILTTHSPFVLDLVDLEKDQVLVFDRDEHGDCRAQPADQERLRVFLDEFLLGEVWYNEGEKGLVKKPKG